MAPKKKIIGKIKLQIEAGKANPSPPVGPALGQKGVNIMDFCKQFNDKTASQAGFIIPVVIDVYEDRSFSFVTKSPPAPVLIKKAIAAGLVFLVTFLVDVVMLVVGTGDYKECKPCITSPFGADCKQLVEDATGD